MSSVLLTNIGELLADPDLPPLKDAAMVLESGRVQWVGARVAAPQADLSHDLAGRAVIPGFVDSHSHLVFAG